MTDLPVTASPSTLSDGDRSAAATIELLRALIRIPSVNPPSPDLPDGELMAARLVADALADAGIPSELHEPVPGRGSVTARVRGDGTGGPPLLLLSHLDVVPAPPDGWTHEPFAGDVADGYVWGRGAVDMKAMAAMEVEVLRRLARRARDAGRDPAADPIPGLRRDVLFAATADEEAGGHAGAGWLAAHRPETLRAAGALNECGGVSMELAGRRLYPIQVAEKGFVVYRITVHGAWGHGSMPRDDNAAVRAAHVVTRLATPGEARLTGPMERLFAELADTLPPDRRALVAAIAGDDPRRAEAALRSLCDPVVARATRALLRDTISPDIIRTGVKYNVIPGEATVEIDCRILPGTSEADIREEVLARLGDLATHCEVELVVAGLPVETSPDTPLFGLLARTIRAHDPDGVPIPVMAPFATDAKHLASLGTPAYGFSPLRNEPGERFLERFHGVDERVSVDAIRWGLPVLFDVVAEFCG
ncbi:MAG TPA: M20/M25/M40 family metallo-hydrolase [Candidatus Limnocylindrales bacterium]|nr:M20/M25/M40 family metallo-hydrolase [Candidatus Limnocylindrales bacterium]